jgi:ferric-dicitrate binding protein FerR (iron transport regulator)
MNSDLAPGPHLTIEQLLDYLEKRLSSNDAQIVEGHLGTECASCQSDLNWLTETLRLMAPDVWLDPPPRLSSAVRQMFRENQARVQPALPLITWFQNLWSQPRRAAIGFAVTLVFVIALGLLLRTQFQTSLKQEVSVAAAAGTVLALPPDSEIWQPLTEDTLLDSGTQIRTGEDSSVLLTYPDDSKTVAAPNTELEILQMSSLPSGNRRIILIRQNLGQTLNLVQPSDSANSIFEIQTPAATVTVRGTEFSVSVSDEGVTEVKVIEGTVEVTAMGMTVTLNVGQSTTVSPGDQPAPPESILPTPSPTPRFRITKTPDEATATEEFDETPTPAIVITRNPTSTPTDSPTRRPTPTAPIPTATAPLPPTSTNTPLPSTFTNTPLPPTSTSTPLPPTPTNTSLPPTSTNKTTITPPPAHTPTPVHTPTPGDP